MITIINYGLGNIRAFSNVYKRLNIPVTIASRKEELVNARRIILPGVGAFDHAMTMLHASGMKDVLDGLVLHKKIPVIGVCVGMQIMAKSSEEGSLPGLGWINGIVKKFDPSTIKSATQLPHMGWNTITPVKIEKLFEKLEEGSRFYFLHSYYFSCFDAENEIAKTVYGNSFCSAIRANNIYGVQFHPEKSHENGICLLSNFAKL